MKHVTWLAVWLIAIGITAGCTGQPGSCLEDMACWDCSSMGNSICGNQ